MRRPATPNLLQNLAKASWNRSAALAIATALLALAPAARAAEFEFKGQKIYYENAELRWIGEGTPEAIPFLIFREDGWFKSTQKAYGRALLVGGGAAGESAATIGQYSEFKEQSAEYQDFNNWSDVTFSIQGIKQGRRVAFLML